MWVPPAGTFRQTVLGGCRWCGDPAGLLRHNLALQVTTGITGWGPQPALLEVGHHCSRSLQLQHHWCGIPAEGAHSCSGSHVQSAHSVSIDPKPHCQVIITTNV